MRQRYDSGDLRAIAQVGRFFATLVLIAVTFAVCVGVWYFVNESNLSASARMDCVEQVRTPTELHACD